MRGAGAASRSLRWRGATLKCRAARTAYRRHGGRRSGQRIEFFAARDIAKGEELTFDYGEEYWVVRNVDPLPSTDTRVTRIRIRRATRRLLASLQAVRWALPL